MLEGWQKREKIKKKTLAILTPQREAPRMIITKLNPSPISA